MKKKAFTLFEIVLALIIFSMLVGIIFTTYINIRKSEWNIWKQQLVTKEANDFLDRLHDLSLDYTIDYEEYFNRRYTRCISWLDERNFFWSCTEFSNYGNNWTWLYYCTSSGNMQISWYQVYHIFKTSIVFPPDWPYWPINQSKGCSWFFLGNKNYWEYKRQFRDIWDWYLNNWDDTFLMEWPEAIVNPESVQELYLINKDWDHRIYFRRKYITWVDLNWDWELTWANEKLYSIQTLKLKWFDAGSWHNFDTWYWWVYDWFIDTRACDAEAGFICSWDLVLTWDYADYRLPSDVDDGRVDITDSRLTVSDWNFELYPAKDPYLAQNDYEYLFDPYATISLTTNIYWEQTAEEITLSTSMSFKNSYHNFEMKELSWFLP